MNTVLKARWPLILALAVAVAGGGAFLGVTWAATRDVFYHDFRTGGPLPKAVRWSGPQVGKFAKLEPEGLRITLPKDREELAQVGFSIALKVRGDFEITATVEVLKAETPPQSPFCYGVGTTMGVDDRARVGRYVRARGEQVILWDFWPVIDGDRKFEGKASPCSATPLRMRLERRGTVLHFLWSAETEGDDFEEIHRTEYGLDDTRFMTFVAESSGSKCAVDLRLLEYRVRSAREGYVTYQWLTAALALGGLAASGVRWWLRRQATKPKPVAKADLLKTS